MTAELPQDSFDQPAQPRFRPVPWIDLRSPHEVEAWIDAHNRSMQENVRANETGYGVCFTLAAGGDIYLQTSADGAVILDVTPDAEWVAPLIMAAAQCAAPAASVWVLPDDKLIQLIVGLSSLVATTTLVVGHDFGRRKSKLGYR